MGELCQRISESLQIMYQSFLKTPSKSQWKKIGLQRRSGVALPLFSIRSKTSAGIGEFKDIKSIIDWCKLTGNSIIQLLPLNDTGFLSSPFSPITSIGLNPIHISLSEIEGGEKESERIKSLFPMEKRVDYRVGKEKVSSLKKIFKKANLSGDFKEFIDKNSTWLDDYATFKTLKDFHKNQPWFDWEKDFRDFNKEKVEVFKEKFKDNILFWKWIQWHSFKQLKSVKDYALKNNILIKGDLPHFISKDSVDCWINRDWFKLQYVAGAPPDYFSKDGQTWGMPPFDWEAIELNNFEFIRRRLTYADNFYDIVRIDHLIGLFRTWIVRGSKAVSGSFDLKEKKDQERRGYTILRKMIDSSTMLLCAEDMGTIPLFCRKTIKDLGIPGLDIGRNQKRYRRLAVSTLSTHDMDLFPEWSSKNDLNERDMDKAMKEILSAPSIFSIPLIFDWLFFSGDIDRLKAPKYRINKPGTISDNNWSIMLPFFVEELVKLPGNKKIRRINQLRSDFGNPLDLSVGN
ncbi:MAG: 4-alpha-glucanotransferase [Minisyncoccales bacterium]